jgi:PAS domain S-box-containing protein
VSKKPANAPAHLPEASKDAILEALDRAGIGVAMADAQDRFIYSNCSHRRVYGRSQEEMLGETWRDLVPPERIPDIEQAISGCMRRGEVFKAALEAGTRGGGKVGHHQIAAVPLANGNGGYAGHVCVVRDVTERRQAEEALAASERFLASVFDGVTDGLSVIDRNFNILRANTTAATWFAGQAPLVGRTCYEAFHGRSKVCEDCPARRTLEEGEPGVEIFTLPGPGGEPRWLEGHTFPFRDQATGEIQGAILYSRDITQRKRVEEALAREAEFNANLAELSRTILATTLNMDDISDLMLEHAKRLTGSPYGFVAYIDPQKGNAIITTLSRDIWDACQVAGKRAVFDKFGGLWGWVLDNREPLLTNDPAGDPRSTGVPEGHIPIRRFLSVPAMMGDKLVGQVALANSERDYTAQDQLVLERLADVYALALQRNRAEEELHGHREHLEQLVGERTAELTAANERLAVEIAERTQAENALRKSEAKYRDLVEQAQEGIWSIDTEGRTRFANAKLQETLGYQVEELESLRFLDLLADEANREQAALLLEAIQSGGCAQCDLSFRRKDGRRVTALFKGCAVLDEATGAYSGAVTCVADITERKMLADRLVQSEKLAALGELISGVAHELNNPLTTVVGRAQLLANRGMRLGEERLKRDLGIVEAEALRASRIVRNLLTFARKQKPEKKRVDINDMLNRTLDLRDYDLRISNIDVERQLGPMLPETSADFQQLQQVVLNIINNAGQAVLETAKKGKILVESEVDDRRREIVIRISDSGPGMPPEIMARIFDPFFTTKPVGKGTGLGLSLSYGIVREHGGEIDVQSEPGQGTTFILRLPVVDPGTDASEKAPREEQAGRAEGRVLVTDDEAEILDLCTDVLRNRGYVVDQARNAPEALMKLWRGAYDVALIDVRMPGLSGPEMYQLIKAERIIPPERIIFMTGDVVGEKTLGFFRREGVSYLAKPFRLDELEALVARKITELSCRTAMPLDA